MKERVKACRKIIVYCTITVKFIIFAIVALVLLNLAIRSIAFYSIFIEQLMFGQSVLFRVQVQVIRFLRTPERDEHRDYFVIEEAVQTDPKSTS